MQTMGDVFDYVYESERVQELLIEVAAGLCRSGPGIPTFTDAEHVAAFIADTDNHYLNRLGACVMAVTAFPDSQRTPAQLWAHVDALISTTDNMDGLADVVGIFTGLVDEWEELQQETQDTAAVRFILEFFAERAKRREIEAMVNDAIRPPSQDS